MDTPPPPPPPDTQKSPKVPSGFPVKKILNIAALSLSLAFLGFLIFRFSPLYPFSKQTANVSTSKPSSSNSPLPQGAKNDKIIAKVGAETIYQTDLNYELAAMPTPTASTSALLKRTALTKLVNDSIILQGGEADKVTTLDPSVFNSPGKDYYKRVKLVASVTKKVSDQLASHLSGTFVAIWFDNGRATTDGDDQRKIIANQKITKLQQDVKSGKITIKQAGEAIQNDSSLIALDPQYKTNAVSNFSADRNQPISFDKAFDNSLWSLPAGSVSDVYLIQDHQTVADNPTAVGKLIDAVYMFGYVSQKTNSSFNSFDDWLSQKRKGYAVNYY